MSRFPLEHTRTTDPETSHAAGASVEADASAICSRIIGIMKRAGQPMAVEQVMVYAGDLKKDQIWRRMSDLKNNGLVEPSGTKHKNRNGRSAIRWQVVAQESKPDEAQQSMGFG